MPDTHRRLKDGLYAQFARIGHAVSTPKRIELLDLLAQAERTVADLAELTATPVKNTSAHLRVLRQAGLVEARRDGAFIHYRLTDRDAHDLVRQLQAMAHARYREVEQLAQLYLEGRDDLEGVTARELTQRLRDGDVTLIDVRPKAEFDAGHIPGALSLPIEQLRHGRPSVPKTSEIIAYCRGRYCVYAIDAVSLLRKRGYRARRLVDGLPGWRAAGHRVEASA